VRAVRTSARLESEIQEWIAAREEEIREFLRDGPPPLTGDADMDEAVPQTAAA
jgi:hypothetical protein